MSSRVLAAHAAATLWELLIATAAEPDAESSIEFIARDGGWSQDSIRRRIHAAAHFLQKGVPASTLRGWGAAKTLSAWQLATNKKHGKAKGTHRYWKRLCPIGQADALDALEKRLRSILGCSCETAIESVLGHYELMEDSEIQHLAQNGEI
jgi:ATP-dependent helicase YprA (DUF1998 family)